ncbi:MAG: hypothetical protein WC635_01270 [Bacteriovorax sp.]|jgi:hypothetical protein
MKSIYGKIFVSLFLLSTTSQVFAMGSKRPSVPDATTVVTTIANQQPSPTTPLPIPLPSTASGNIYLGLIESLALNSACTQVSFANLGIAPLAFIKGLTQNYAQGLCQSKAKSRFFAFTRLLGFGNVLTEVLTNFQSRFRSFPISSRQFTSAPACNQLLSEVQDLISNDQYACDDIAAN